MDDGHIDGAEQDVRIAQGKLEGTSRSDVFADQIVRHEAPEFSELEQETLT